MYNGDKFTLSRGFICRIYHCMCVCNNEIRKLKLSTKWINLHEGQFTPLVSSLISQHKLKRSIAEKLLNEIICIWHECKCFNGLENYKTNK